MNYVKSWLVPTTKTVHAPAANTAAVVTVTAPGAGKRTFIDFIGWSYTAAPTGGNLTITDGGVTVLDMDITAAGPDHLPVSFPFGVNSQVVVTLAAPGGTVVGTLTVHSHTEFEAPNKA